MARPTRHKQIDDVLHLSRIIARPKRLLSHERQQSHLARADRRSRETTAGESVPVGICLLGSLFYSRVMNSSRFNNTRETAVQAAISSRLASRWAASSLAMRDVSAVDGARSNAIK